MNRKELDFKSSAYATRWFSTAALALVVLVVLAPAAGARSAPDSFADIVEKLLPAVVNISTSQIVKKNNNRRGLEIPQFPPGSPFEEFFREFFDRRRPDAPTRRATSLGSGFVVDAAGYVVTNNHVIAEADEIEVIFQDKTTLKATVVGRDAKTDLALLKVETDKKLTAVKWGDSDETRVGDWIIAIGNPFGLGSTVTAGILSARARNINAGPYDDVLQTDASINRGNSGGPMFNTDGQVIGVNTAIFSPTGGSIGIGFAIPSILAEGVISQLREFGRTRRAWLGVRIQSVTEEIAESLGLDDARGALVASVTKGGPSEGKIKPGDVVLRFDGRPVSESRRLPRMVALQTKVGKEVAVVVWRGGKKVTVKVTLAELEQAEAALAKAPDGDDAGDGKPVEVEALGLTVTAITADMRARYELGDESVGVVIVKVATASAAAEKGIRPGDVIVEIGQQEVAGPADFAAKVAAAAEAKRRSVLLLLERDGNLRFVALRVAGG